MEDEGVCVDKSNLFLAVRVRNGGGVRSIQLND
jgi:hypothetical protein